MRCAYCEREIESNEVVFENLSFCNNLCKYSWNKNRQTPATNEKVDNTESEGIFLENLDFQIDLEELADKKLILRASYLFGPQLYLDDKKLKPVKKQRRKRIRTYVIYNENGVPVEISLHLRFFDAIPGLIINGKEVDIVPKYTKLEYAFIAIPAVLLYMGGLLGGLIGAAAVFTNSVLLRKIRRKAVRYSMVGFNIIAAFMIYFKVLVYIYPYMTDLEFRISGAPTVINNNSQILPLTQHVWETYKLTNMENNEISDNNAIIGAKRYFFGNGKFSTVMKNHTIIEAKWNVDPSGKYIIVKGTNDEAKAEIVKLSDDEFVFQYNNVYYYQRAI